MCIFQETRMKTLYFRDNRFTVLIAVSFKSETSNFERQESQRVL